MHCAICHAIDDSAHSSHFFVGWKIAIADEPVVKYLPTPSRKRGQRCWNKGLNTNEFLEGSTEYLYSTSPSRPHISKRSAFFSRVLIRHSELTVKELMRHKTLEVTLRYAHLAPEHLSEALDKLEQYKANCNASVIAAAGATGTQSLLPITNCFRMLVPEEGVEPTRGVIPGRF
jgi:hypothetical protein